MKIPGLLRDSSGSPFGNPTHPEKQIREERVLWAGQETTRASAKSGTHSPLPILSPFGFQALSVRDESSSVTTTDRHTAPPLAAFPSLHLPSQEESCSEESHGLSDDEAPPDITRTGGGVKLSLGIFGFEDERCSRVNPLEVKVESCDGDWNDFVPTKVQFNESDASFITENTYEAFDWEDFDEDRIYGPLPPFDYIQDMCLTESPEDLIRINVMVAPSSPPLKSILKLPAAIRDRSFDDDNGIDMVGFSTRNAERFHHTRSLDQTVYYRSPAPTGTALQAQCDETDVLPVTAKRDQHGAQTPIAARSGVTLSLSFFN